jgi:serine/threonine-protein kinase
MDPDAPTITLSRPGSASQKPQDITIPATLGSVRLLNQIGQGGMGVVYRARDQLLGRDVAVKFITNAIATPDDPGFNAFLEGARAGAALQHASLTTIHQAGVVEGVPYIVMQLVEGPTVSELIRATGPLSQDEALAILIDVASAIAELHDRSIIHRDIKPSNVLLDADGKVIVSDFGLAHRRRAAHTNQPSSGTPAYMAPEMAAGEVNPRTDVYALGIMGYELLAGKLPFRGDVTQTMELHKSAPLPLADLQNISPQVVETLERAAHKNPLFRHKSARQFARALQAATDSTKIAQGRYAIIQRITHRTRTPDSTGAPDVHPGLPTPPPDPATPPAPSTYFNHLSRIAATKRSQRPAIDPPPLAPARNCLHCGYDRRGLEESKPCPECGHLDDFTQQQSLCAALAQKPRKLWWRLFTFRAPPLGWWEVFNSENPLQKFTPLRNTLIILLGALLTTFVIAGINFMKDNIQVERTVDAWLYRSDDPTKTRISLYAKGSETTTFFDRAPRGAYNRIPPNPMPGFSTDLEWTERIVVRPPRRSQYLTLGFFTTFSALTGWIIYRHLWLNLLLYRRPDLSDADRSAVRTAAAPFSLIFLVLPAWLLVSLALVLIISSFTIVPFYTAVIVTGVAILTLPPFIWARSISADRSRRIFNNRPLASVLLIAAIFAHILTFALSNLAARTLYHFMLDQNPI